MTNNKYGNMPSNDGGNILKNIRYHFKRESYSISSTPFLTICLLSDIRKRLIAFSCVLLSICIVWTILPILFIVIGADDRPSERCFPYFVSDSPNDTMVYRLNGTIYRDAYCTDYQLGALVTILILAIKFGLVAIVLILLNHFYLKRFYYRSTAHTSSSLVDRTKGLVNNMSYTNQERNKNDRINIAGEWKSLYNRVVKILRSLSLVVLLDLLIVHLISIYFWRSDSISISASIILASYALLPLKYRWKLLILLIYSLFNESIGMITRQHGYAKLSALYSTNAEWRVSMARLIFLHLALHLLGWRLHRLISKYDCRAFRSLLQFFELKKFIAENKNKKLQLMMSIVPPSYMDQLLKEQKTSREAITKELIDELKNRQTKVESSTNHNSGFEIEFKLQTKDNVSILFADIVGFTSMSSTTDAERLVYLLNDLYGRFDLLCEQTGCLKIATLGDCYYCVSGCPESRDDHSLCCIRMGQEMIKEIEKFNKVFNHNVNMRVGIHTGQVKYGVLGTRVYKFDVFSDDVNIANKMESSGVAGRVHISQLTYNAMNEYLEKSKTIVDFGTIPDLHVGGLDTYLIVDENEDQANIVDRTTEKRTAGKGGKKTVAKSKRDKLAQQQEMNNKKPISAPIAVDTIVTKNDLAAGSGDGVMTETKLIDVDGKMNIDACQGSTIMTIPTIGEDGRVHVDIETTFMSPKHKNYVVNEEMENKNLLKKDDLSMKVHEELVLNNPDDFIARLSKPIGIGCLSFKDRDEEYLYKYDVLTLKQNFYSDSWLVQSCTLGDVVTYFIYISLLILASSLTLPLNNVAWIYSTTIGLLILLPILITFTVLAWKGDSHMKRLANFTKKLLFRYLCLTVMVVVPFFVASCSLSCLGSTEYAHDDSTFSITLMVMAVCVSILPIVPGVHFLYRMFIIFLLLLIYILVFLVFDVCDNELENEWITLFFGMGARTYDAIGAIILIFIVFCIIGWIIEYNIRVAFNSRLEVRIAQRLRQNETQQADELLRQCLPSYIIDSEWGREREKMTSLDTPRLYSKYAHCAAVVFADMNFFDLYEESYKDGIEYLRLLNEIIGELEQLLDQEKYKDVVKIKTIGSVLMVATGLNPAIDEIDDDEERRKLDDQNLICVMEFAIEMLEKMENEINGQMLSFLPSSSPMTMRIGYNSGPVVAGIIGQKPSYDIWGDTVNVASRMCSNGHVGKIQVPKNVAERLAPYYEFEYRGEMFIKGKNNMEIYHFKNRKKSD
ncbi:hypothetical protein SNEBB_001545 [Seison nebaliae]|nr:hypothetical protein SNEBB_001545 [Seison nebaliae]